MKPERKSYDPEDDDGSWSRPTLVSRYNSLGYKGKLYWFGGLLIAANLIGFIFGIYWPRMLIAGACAVVIGFFLPKSIDD